MRHIFLLLAVVACSQPTQSSTSQKSSPVKALDAAIRVNEDALDAASSADDDFDDFKLPSGELQAKREALTNQYLDDVSKRVGILDAAMIHPSWVMRAMAGTLLMLRPTPDAAARLSTLVHDRTAVVRVNALAALARVDPADKATFIAALRDPSSSVRGEALTALSKRVGDDVEHALEQLIITDPYLGPEAEKVLAVVRAKAAPHVQPARPK